jgi:hypothetical protein
MKPMIKAKNQPVMDAGSTASQRIWVTIVA